MDNTRKILLNHCKMYPCVTPRDIFKFLYQSVFGCEHLIASSDTVIDNIKKEYKNYKSSGNIVTEQLDGDFSRVHLDWIDEGLSADTLGKLMLLSAKKTKGSIEELEKKLFSLEKMIDEFPFDRENYYYELERWRVEGYPSLHHSDLFREKYTPAYRVIGNEYTNFLHLFATVDKILGKKPITIAIDGGSGSGKTTLSNILSYIYDCNVFHTDDFFLQPVQRTKNRLSEPGGNFDRERFLEEVLNPLKRGEKISYRRFDCSTMDFLPPSDIIPKKLNIIEGAYCMHTEFSGYYDFSVFLDITSDVQKKRINKRNSPKMAERFFEEWIPMEHKYFEEMNVKNRCNIIFDINQ